LKKIAGAAVASISMAFAIYLLCEYAIGIDIKGYVVRRMVTVKENEFVTLHASIGYRIYESYAIWEKRTLFGHGTGAYIYLVKPFKGKIKFMKWWSIHSEYSKFFINGVSLASDYIFGFSTSFSGNHSKSCDRKKVFVHPLGAIAFLITS